MGSTIRKTDKSIILMGIKHCGKTTQGKRLASHFNCHFYDTDDVVLQQSGFSPRELYMKAGAECFKEAEIHACEYLASLVKEDSSVIATGGGFCTNASAVSALRPVGIFVFLRSNEVTAADRIIQEIKIAADGSLMGIPAYIAEKKPRSESDVRSIFHTFFLERNNLYESLADITIDILPVPFKQNTDLIIQTLFDQKK